MTRRVRLFAVAAVVSFAGCPEVAQSQFIRDDFNTGYERASQQADCPGVLAGLQAETRDDTFGCWAALADSNPLRGSWVDVRVQPGFALVYVNGRYAGTAQQFTKPFRPLRVGLGPQRIEFRAPGYRALSFWVNGDTGKVTTATETLTKNR
jgi:hypothetical protein